MAIDPYSPCPGGTGKKIKFCCPDLLGDLNTLVRMIEGEQHAAALAHLRAIESPAKPRACLAALKIQLLRAAGRDEEMRAAVQQFVDHFPDNPIALAESALNVAVDDEDGPAAMRLLQKAIAASGVHLYPQVYAAIAAIAELMADSGLARSAMALWHLQTILDEDDQQPRQLLTRTCRSDAVPLLVKDEPILEACPKGFARADRFATAIEPLAKAHWAEAAGRFDNLAQEVPTEPALWRNLAIVRGWLADHAGAIAALEKFASLEVPLEDAVEAAATAMLLAEDPLGDAIDAVRLTFTVGQADELAGFFSTWQHAAVVPVDPAMFADEEVPPKMTFWLLDRPTPEQATELTLDTVPSVLGHAMLFGRQTDREARLVFLGATSADEEQIVRLLDAVGNGRIAGPPEREVLGQMSATRTLLRRPWRLPPGTPRETALALASQYLEHAVFEAWPKVTLGALEGRSAQEVVAEPDKKVPLLAAILVLDGWIHQMNEPLDLNRLRSQLGLPTLGPIDPQETPIEGLPLVRLHRVAVEKLSDEQLLGGFRRAFTYGADQAIAVFGRELVDRPNVSAKDRQFALVALATGQRDPQRAFDYVERGRTLAESAGQSSASWDLIELDLRAAQQDTEGVRRLFDHLQRDHLREPGVADAIGQFLYRAGVIDAQGRPIQHGPAPEDLPEPAEEQPASQLWTPDSEKPSGEKSKLWTPDMG